MENNVPPELVVSDLFHQYERGMDIYDSEMGWSDKVTFPDPN